MWPFIAGLRTYSILYCLGIVLHFPIAIVLCRKFKVALWVAFSLGLCYLLGMVVGAKLLYDLQHHTAPWSAYLSGAHYMNGGFWGGPLAYFALSLLVVAAYSRDRRRALDISVLAVMVPMIVAKLACFANGCCYGHETPAAWAVSFPEGADAPANIPRHPTQLYEILVLLLIAILFVLLDRERWKGTFLFWFLMLYGTGRTLTEVFRGDLEKTTTVGPLTASQAVCMVVACLSAIALVIAGKRTRMTTLQSTMRAEKGGEDSAII